MDLKGMQTEKNLLVAYHGESNNRNMYTFFAEKAKEEVMSRLLRFLLRQPIMSMNMQNRY